MAAIVKFNDALRRAIDGAAALLIFLVTVLGIGQVISRYVFNSSLVWSEELIRLLYVWLVLIAASTAPHMKISFLEGMLPRFWTQILKVAQTLIMLVLLALLVWGALRLNTAFGNDRYVTLGVAKSWYWTGAVVGGLLWAGSILSQLAAGLAAPREG
ncbi:TRAP transporter small permease subunit [uncultured Hoeflea sp.]|uniref:TRAP transporter small permease n=1 Tax=uncultured Hoeflea sp. TaxID=538666 RepID=UPI002612BFAE|nr:TRAP transporter small permease subunit [uncultured Hoeflea sp.]